ncbi:hypothetical protein ACFV1N_25580 [Streptosporangium canum]|uniref:hypothetical protein n=1 Tax=Streptosporangium canum TaxID=324952 RepID=UPI003675364D
MLKLTKEQAKRHREADDLVRSPARLSDEETEFVLLHWQEASTITNSLSGAFFTPLEMAKDVALNIWGSRVIDLCAGIGHLAWGYRCRYVNDWERDKPPLELVCVEKNPAYVEVGRRLLPDATWICADVFDVVELELGSFHAALANPPFGRIDRAGRQAPRYRGPLMEYHVIDVAAELAPSGVFIVPQTSAPFRYSGPRPSVWEEPPAYRRFVAQTGVELRFNIGVDTTLYDGWHGVAPTTEIVTADLSTRRARASVVRPAAAIRPPATPRLGSPVPQPLF